jgi:hypothetical protein
MAVVFTIRLRQRYIGEEGWLLSAICRKVNARPEVFAALRGVLTIKAQFTILTLAECCPDTEIECRPIP